MISYLEVMIPGKWQLRRTCIAKQEGGMVQRWGMVEFCWHGACFDWDEV